MVLCPSNPYLSVDPILALAGVRAALAGLGVPRIAVSPLIGGQAVKGPLVALMASLGREGPGGGAVTNQAIAEHYGALLSHIMIDRHDDEDARGLRGRGLCVRLADTLMRSGEDRARLARAVLAAAGVNIGGVEIGGVERGE